MRIDGATRFLGLVGKPVAHSLSPQIQNHALSRLGENVVYLPFEVAEEDLADWIRLFARIGGIGLNVTTPYKARVGEIVRAGDDEVATTGIVNTVVYKDQSAVGFSTDGLGFQSWLRVQEIRPAAGGIVMLGFGATARSLTYRLGCEHPLTIVTQKPSQTETFVERWYARGWAGLPVRVVSWHDAPPAAPSLMIGALPVAVSASPQVADWLSTADPETIVVDLNYGPGRTPMHDQARDLGLTAYDGIGLLVHQAALSLGRWLEAEIPTSLLDEAVDMSP